jgi:formate hydrogenlyase subunit 6/NADH:ubiquinone oxidoreductase subunit I
MIDDIATVTSAEDCDYTGACQEICPTDAVSLTYIIVFSTGRRRRP